MKNKLRNGIANIGVCIVIVIQLHHIHKQLSCHFREVEIMRRINHKNILKLIDFCNNGIYFDNEEV